jgi:hypothetical protein
VGLHSIGDHTAIELKGPDRTGLLSEIFAVLADLQCNVLAAEVWTHRMRVACVVYVNDVATRQAIDDPCRVSTIENRLRHVLRGYGGGGGNDDGRGAHANFTDASSTPHHLDRRLHQLMHADVDAVHGDGDDGAGAGAPVAAGGEGDRPEVTVEHCEEKSYSVVNVKCKDRSKLLFDIVCTLTDMEYVVFHAAVSSEANYGIQVHTHRFHQCLMLFTSRLYQAMQCKQVHETFPSTVLVPGAVHPPQGRQNASERRSREGGQVPGSSHF